MVVVVYIAGENIIVSGGRAIDTEFFANVCISSELDSTVFLLRTTRMTVP